MAQPERGLMQRYKMQSVLRLSYGYYEVLPAAFPDQYRHRRTHHAPGQAFRRRA